VTLSVRGSNASPRPHTGTNMKKTLRAAAAVHMARP
jgi:hypothetical protein